MIIIILSLHFALSCALRFVLHFVYARIPTLGSKENVRQYPQLHDGFIALQCSNQRTTSSESYSSSFVIYPLGLSWASNWMTRNGRHIHEPTAICNINCCVECSVEFCFPGLFTLSYIVIFQYNTEIHDTCTVIHTVWRLKAPREREKSVGRSGCCCCCFCCCCRCTSEAHAPTT